MQFLASGYLEYARLSTRLMADAKPLYRQLGSIDGLARTTMMPDLKVEDHPKVDADVMNRLPQANHWYLLDLVAVAQQPGWDGEPEGMTLGSSAPGTGPLWNA